MATILVSPVSAACLFVQDLVAQKKRVAKTMAITNNILLRVVVIMVVMAHLDHSVLQN